MLSISDPPQSRAPLARLTCTPQRLLSQPERLECSHKDFLILADLLNRGYYRVTEVNHLGFLGIAHLPVPASQAVNQQSVVITNYYYSSDTESITVRYRFAPAPQRTVLRGVEEAPSYPASLTNLILPGDSRHGRLSVVKDPNDQDWLGVQDNLTKEVIGIVPTAIAKKLLHWYKKDIHHGLHVRTNWHIKKLPSPRPMIEVEISPYWRSDTEIDKQLRELVETSKGKNRPVTKRAWAVEDTDTLARLEKLLDGLGDSQDQDGGGHTPARRMAMRTALQGLVAQRLDDRDTYDCLTKRNLETVLEICDMMYPRVVEMLRIRTLQGGGTIDADLQQRLENLGLVEPKAPVPVAPVHHWNLKRCAQFFKLSTASTKIILEKHPECIVEGTPPMMVDPGILALTFNGRSDDQEDLFTPEEIAKYLHLSAATISHICRDGTIPSINCTKELNGKEMKKNTRRISMTALCQKLEIPRGAELVRMEDINKLYRAAGIKHLTDAQIATFITERLTTLGEILGLQVRLFVKEDVMGTIEAASTTRAPLR